MAVKTGAGIKEVTTAINAITSFGKGISDVVTGNANDLSTKVEDALYGSDQVDAIKGYIKKVEDTVAALYSDMQYWTEQLQKVYDEVYKAESASVAKDINNETESISGTGATNGGTN